MKVRKAELADVSKLLPLFNSYRSFYDKPEESAKALKFLSDNIRENRSIIFVAWETDLTAVGFIQMYPRVSSLSMTPYMYLSDLFVAEPFRRRGIGKKLMLQATEHSTAFGASSLQLETAHSNKIAQALYESIGYVHESEYRTYVLGLQSKSGERESVIT